jgi:hypothetical protein
LFLVARGHDGSNYQGVTLIETKASEAFTGSARGAQIEFSTTKNGTTTRTVRMILGNDGNLTIGYGMADQYPTALTIAESTHASSRRAGIAVGAQWILNQDSLGNGTKDFSIYNVTAGRSVFQITPALQTYYQCYDAATNTVVDVTIIDHNSSGTPAANFGTGLLLRGESDSVESREMGRLRTLWVTATDGSRKARSVWSAWDTAERDCIAVEASGSASKVGFQGTNPIVKPTVSGSRAANAALASLLTALANYGLITDSTSA